MSAKKIILVILGAIAFSVIGGWVGKQLGNLEAARHMGLPRKSVSPPGEGARAAPLAAAQEDHQSRVSREMRAAGFTPLADPTYPEAIWAAEVQRLSWTESIRILIVPGTERCVIYSSIVTSTMWCRDITRR